MRLTWYGHSAFRIEFGGTALLLDPFLSGNPTWDGGWEGPADGVDFVLLTHGHDDHFGDTVAIAKATGATVVAPFEICEYLGTLGVDKVNPGGHGGTLDCGSFTVSFVPAWHSSSVGRADAPGGFVYMGNPCGLVITPVGDKPIYAMGDTGIFGDMALIDELYGPKVGIVPIGDRFTMGAKHAALACKRYFNFDNIVPCHYGTFDALDMTPEKFLNEMGPEAKAVIIPERGVPVDI